MDTYLFSTLIWTLLMLRAFICWLYLSKAIILKASREVSYKFLKNQMHSSGSKPETGNVLYVDNLRKSEASEHMLEIPGKDNSKGVSLWLVAYPNKLR